MCCTVDSTGGAVNYTEVRRCVLLLARGLTAGVEWYARGGKPHSGSPLLHGRVQSEERFVDPSQLFLPVLGSLAEILGQAIMVENRRRVLCGKCKQITKSWLLGPSAVGFLMPAGLLAGLVCIFARDFKGRAMK